MVFFIVDAAIQIPKHLSHGDGIDETSLRNFLSIPRKVVEADVEDEANKTLVDQRARNVGSYARA